MHFQKRIARHTISQKKLKKIKTYITTLARFPTIQMIGISGSVAMMNAQEKDDIDLFIITRENQIWTGRLTALLLAQWYGIRRKRTDWKEVADKVCLNLFFDKQNMVIPTYKRSHYVGHEILQFKPMVNKNQTYEAFLAQNDWVFDMFPNSQLATLKSPLSTLTPPVLKPTTHNLQPVTLLESLAKSVQLPRIRAHQTNEIITETQLWFFPDDYEERIELHV
jgi:predicted nucleotidyltransferase